MKRRKVSEHRCGKCGKLIAQTVPPYQRLNWFDDICICDKDDPAVKGLLKRKKELE